MKRWITPLCMLLVLSGCVYPAPEPPGTSTAQPSSTVPHPPASASETSPAGGEYTVFSDALVVLLAQPEEGSDILRALPNGTAVRLMGREGKYARVWEMPSGKQGYVLESQLAEGKGTPPPTQELIIGAIYGCSARQSIDLLSSPNASSTAVSRLSAGELVCVLWPEGEYALVQAVGDGRRGYAPADYLAWADRQDMGLARLREPGRYVVLCREPVAFSFADGSGEILLSAGTQVDVPGFREGAALVVYDGRQGYLPEESLTPAAAQTLPASNGEVPVHPEPASYKVVCREFLTLRKAPSTSAQEIARLRSGEIVEVLRYDGFFAYVKSGGATGYVLASYLQPIKVSSDTVVVKPVEAYSYQQMLLDLVALVKKYPGRLSIQSIGTTLQGRDIPVVILGNPNASRHILVHAGIHAREHMTSLLAMALIEYSLAHGDEPFADATMEDWLSAVCLHIVPMVNPDGIMISQTGPDTPQLRAMYEADRKRGVRLAYKDYVRMWKANAAGVDLNRNFDAGWQDQVSPSGPSYERYKGTRPEDQPETRALVEYTKAHSFAATISYHAFGCCLYWQFGGDEKVNALSRDLGLAVRAYTGYTLEGSEGQDSAGYKDWAMETMGIPSLTVEVGTQECPLPLEEYQSIWTRNKKVLAAVARWVVRQPAPAESS
jgi:g-D-glutamyl-meso-diaminopimelate peptidase